MSGHPAETSAHSPEHAKQREFNHLSARERLTLAFAGFSVATPEQKERAYAREPPDLSTRQRSQAVDELRSFKPFQDQPRERLMKGVKYWFKRLFEREGDLSPNDESRKKDPCPLSHGDMVWLKRMLVEETWKDEHFNDRKFRSFEEMVSFMEHEVEHNEGLSDTRREKYEDYLDDFKSIKQNWALTNLENPWAKVLLWVKNKFSYAPTTYGISRGCRSSSWPCL